eukprot:742861-Ditylum_brightwellii.AAC.1
MGAHFTETSKLFAYYKHPWDKNGKPLEPPAKTDSYARHFAAVLLKEFPEQKAITSEFQRDFIECSQLWQGNPISA